MNAGFSVAKQRDDFDCFIFHDVDLLPRDDRNFYTCSPTPRHVAGFINKWGYRYVHGPVFHLRKLPAIDSVSLFIRDFVQK